MGERATEARFETNIGMAPQKIMAYVYTNMPFEKHHLKILNPKKQPTQE